MCTQLTRIFSADDIRISYTTSLSLQVARITHDGRSALYLQRSLAMFHAASVDSPESTSIYRTHALRGLPLGAATDVVVGLTTRVSVNSQTPVSMG